ncbi:HTH-type transcriptional regulator Xre [subsurface metagenome]
MAPSAIIGKNIKSYREKLHLSQEEVAEFLGVSREQISYYENGRRDVQLDKLEKLADLFGIKLINLLEEDISIMEADLAFAFRSDSLEQRDMEHISNFHRIIKNYLKMKQILTRK